MFLLLTLLSLGRSAQSQALSWVTNSDNASLTITGFTAGEAPGNLTIPSQINGMSVMAIGAYAFNGDSSLTNVAIPGSVINIGFQAFEGCVNLATLTLSNGVQTIADQAFYATQISQVTIPDSVTSIGTAAFDTSTLLGITVSPGNTAYTSIDGVLFNESGTVLLQYPGARADGSYTVPTGVLEIGPSAMSAPNLTNVSLPSSLLNIADYAFEQAASASGLMSVTIPVSVTNVGFHAFYGTRLRDVLIPSGVTNIGTAAFLNCVTLTAINVDPNNTTYSSVDGVLFDIQQSVLLQYPPAKKASVYTLPSSVSTIGTTAFAASPKLTTIVAANRVTNVQDGAFFRCDNLQNVYFAGNEPVTGSAVFDSDSNLTVWYLPSSSGWGSEFASRPTAPFTFLSAAATRDSSGQFSFDILGPDGSTVIIEATAGLNQPLSWSPIQTVQLTNGLFKYVETPQEGPSRFIRARIP